MSKVESFESLLEKVRKSSARAGVSGTASGKSLDMFEKGVHLYRQCKRQLGEVEKKINVLADNLNEEDSPVTTKR